MGWTPHARKPQFAEPLIASVATRPIPGAGSAEILAARRTFAVCGKLTRVFDEPSSGTRSARMTLVMIERFHDVAIV
jgi:hypothetical protein